MTTNLTELSSRASAQRESKAFIVAERGKISYGEQRRRSGVLAAWLSAHDLPVGAHVLVGVTDDLEQASILLALVLCGRTPLLVDPSSTRNEISSILDSARIDGMIMDSDTRARWNLDDDARPWLQVAIAGNESKMLSRLLRKRHQNERTNTWPSIVDDGNPPSIEPSADGPLAYIIFTSGTTSTPKGVEITPSALLAQMENLRQHFALSEDTRILNVLPLHHADGWVQGPLMAWFNGATLHRPVRFSAQTVQAFMDTVYRERITHLIAVPTMLSMMWRLGKDWSDVFEGKDFRFIVSAAGHLEEELWRNIESAFSTRVVNMYGLSETGTTALFSGPDNDSHRIGSIGRPVGFDIRIVSEDIDVPQGAIGELWLSGPQLMQGYHHRPDDTAAVLSEGWLRTGDLVREADDGNIEIVGRAKSLIVSGGRNISPQEVAESINSHPAIVESIVLGLPDSDWGERVVALVVAAHTPVAASDIVSWCREHLSEYKVPKDIYFTEELERGPSGKIILEAARKRLETLVSQPDHASQDTSVEDHVYQIAARSFRVAPESLSTESGPDNTVGWDSLAHMEFVIALEKQFDVKLSAREIMQIDSIARATAICRQKLAA